MKTLKIMTTGFLIAGLVMLFAWPWAVGKRPIDKPHSEIEKKDLARYGIRALTYFTLTTCTFLAAATGAVLIIRRTRREFVDNEIKIVRGLVEGSLKDHERE